MASGMVRMSENRIAASRSKRSSGCSVTSQARSGFWASAMKLPARAARGAVFGQVAAGLAHDPYRRGVGGLAAQRAQEAVVLEWLSGHRGV